MLTDTAIVRNLTGQVGTIVMSCHAVDQLVLYDYRAGWRFGAFPDTRLPARHTEHMR